MYVCVRLSTCIYLYIYIYIYIYVIYREKLLFIALPIDMRKSKSVPRSFSPHVAAEVNFLIKKSGKQTIHVRPGLFYFRVQGSEFRGLELSHGPCLLQCVVEVYGFMDFARTCAL